MPYGPISAESPAVETFLLGQIPYLRCLEFQQRLVRQAAGRDNSQIVVLMCEHPAVISIGRGGRPSQIVASKRLLESRQIESHWTNRGGGCMVHCPGQLAIYPILPLRVHDFSLGEYVHRLQAALAETLTELGVPIQPQPGRYGVWGRTGQIASLGVAVRDWITWQGAYLNVSPALGLFKLVESDSQGQSPMSSIAAERCGVVRMATVRAILVRHLTAAFGCDRYHLYTGHPWLKEKGEAR
jgi:lipoyl(octanoyl) transferase